MNAKKVTITPSQTALKISALLVTFTPGQTVLKINA